MFHLAMASALPRKVPAVPLHIAEKVADFHTKNLLTTTVSPVATRTPFDDRLCIDICSC
jgi:hypothetical protein